MDAIPIAHRRRRGPLPRAAALLILITASLAAACDRGEAAPEEPGSTSAPAADEGPTPTAAQPGPADPADPDAPPVAGPIPEDWVAARVGDARKRLEATDAGQLVWKSIEAHGGLRSWLAPGTIAFRFDYHPVGDSSRRMHTRQRVDLWRARAVHEEVEDDPDDGAEATFGWNGEVAWIRPGPDAFPITPRFWALTPYYFVGMPFVLGDPGVHFERLDDAELDGKTWTLVKATFDPGTGDAPDDYYIVYLDPETHRLHALRYVVSYPGFEGKMFEPGGHTPETLMRFTEPTEVGGLTLFGRLDTWKWNADEGVPADKRVNVTADGYELGETIPGRAFDPPDEATVIEQM